MQFNVDAGALVDELAATIANLQKENLILRHQLKDAEKQINEAKAMVPKEDHTHDKPESLVG